MEFYIHLQKEPWCPDQKYFAETNPGTAFISGQGAPFLVTAQRIHIDADTIGKFGLCGASAQKNESIGDAAHGVSAPWRRSGLK